MNFGPGSGLTIDLSNSQIDLSLSQITETIVDTYYNEDNYNLEKSQINQELYSLEKDLHMLKEINTDMNQNLIKTDTNNYDFNDIENIDMNKLVELTSNVDEEIIKEQNEEIQKVEQGLNDLKELVNEVNKIIVINKEDLEAVEKTVEKVEDNVDDGHVALCAAEELQEASIYVDWLNHKNTKIAGAATVVGLTTGGLGYLFGTGAMIASGMAVAAGATTGVGTKVILRSISQKLRF